MNIDDIRSLYDYNQWANRRTLDACAGLTQAQFTQRIESSFPSLRETLVHICAGEWIWLERWLDRTPPTEEWKNFGNDLTDFPKLRVFWDGRDAKLMQFVGSLSPEKLAAPLEIRTTDGTLYVQPLWQQMQHLANHGTYHRGQVTMMLRQLGAKPVPLDLIRFYRERQSQATA